MAEARRYVPQRELGLFLITLAVIQAVVMWWVVQDFRNWPLEHGAVYAATWVGITASAVGFVLLVRAGVRACKGGQGLRGGS